MAVKLSSSSIFTCDKDVSHGSVLGPILISLYVAGLPELACELQTKNFYLLLRRHFMPLVSQNYKLPQSLSSVPKHNHWWVSKKEPFCQFPQICWYENLLTKSQRKNIRLSFTDNLESMLLQQRFPLCTLIRDIVYQLCWERRFNGLPLLQRLLLWLHCEEKA